MTRIRFRINPHASGPLFDRRAARAAADYSDQVQREIAQHANGLVHARLQKVLKNPTGYYESRVFADRTVSEGWVVHDNDVPYGPWLEGVSSRNQTTRFKGYGTFRRVKALVQRQAPGMARTILARYRGRI